jgi:hypothetical protein
MTFPSPFESGEPPALDAVVEASGYDRASVQALADKLIQTVAQATGDDKLKLRQRKGNMTKAVQSPTKRDRANVFNPIVNKLLAGVQNGYQDDDAELISILPRLGSALVEPAGGSQATVTSNLPPANECFDSTLEECIGPSAPSTQDYPPFPVDPPGRWVRCAEGWYRCWPRGGITSVPPPIPPPGPPPSPPPPPVPPPPCPPCPPCPPPPPPPPPPGPILIGPAPCPVGVPESAPPSAVYAVPWLDPVSNGTPSIWSDCGQKRIEEAFGQSFPADDETRAIARGQGWYNDYLGPTRQMLSDDDDALIHRLG